MHFLRHCRGASRCARQQAPMELPHQGECAGTRGNGGAQVPAYRIETAAPVGRPPVGRRAVHTHAITVPRRIRCIFRLGMPSPRGRGKAAQPADAAVIGERRGTGPRPTTNGYGCTRRDGTLPSARQAPGHALHQGECGGSRGGRAIDNRPYERTGIFRSHCRGASRCARRYAPMTRTALRRMRRKPWERRGHRSPPYDEWIWMHP